VNCKNISFIKENYQATITLQQLADMHFISPEHLSRTFKKETNFGFNEFISLVRLQKAEFFLKEHPEMSISEVAYACGFNDSNYFSDKFKRTYGISPLRYSKSFKANKASKSRKTRKKKSDKDKNNEKE
jgi:AraC-like DNA-binding protein